MWPALGLLGSCLASGAATRLLNHRPVSWWWRAPLPAAHWFELNLLWTGVVLLAVAWVGLGRRLAIDRSARPGDVIAVGALWALPLALGPALFSQDMYSYLAQGSVLAHGLNPYHVAPSALARWHETRLLATVSANWRGTTAPYGPVFLGLADLASKLAGGDVVLGIEFVRVIALGGLALLALSVPRLARRLGADDVQAVWLVVASPVSLISFVAGGHNDALMAGLMVAGVTLALQDRPLAGLALCALAATVKLPAAAGVAVIAICWLRDEPARWRQILPAAGVVVAGVVLAVGAVTGVGLSWISASLFSTPASVRLAITPATALAVTIHELGHGVHSGVEQAAAGLESALVKVGMAFVVLFAAWLCLDVRRERLARALGLMLIVAAIGGPAAWPWYLIWGTALLAADPVAQRSPWLQIAMLVPAFALMPGGDVVVSLPHAYELLILYACAATVAVGAGRRRRRAPASRVPAVPRPEVA